MPTITTRHGVEIFGKVAEEWDPEDVQGLPARDAHDTGCNNADLLAFLKG